MPLGIPLGDWQFYAVSLATAWGLWALIRPFLPARDKIGGCPGCGPGKAKKRSPRSRLTVEGKRV